MSDFWLGWLCGAVPMFSLTVGTIIIINIVGDMQLLGKRKKKKKLEKIEPYFAVNTGSQDLTAAVTSTVSLDYTMTGDGFEYVTIRTLISKLNEIIEYISEEKQLKCKYCFKQFEATIECFYHELLHQEEK